MLAIISADYNNFNKLILIFKSLLKSIFLAKGSNFLTFLFLLLFYLIILLLNSYINNKVYSINNNKYLLLETLK